MKEKFFQKPEFRQEDLDALGLPNESFHYLREAGYIKASIKQANGPGTRNVYSFDDVMDLFAMKSLTRVGFSPRMAAIIVKEGRAAEVEKLRGY